MKYTRDVINELERNADVYESLLKDRNATEYLWKPSEDKWCLLEILCHIYDEEIEDFRTRCKHVLDSPEKNLPPIDPSGWVKKRHYIEQDYKLRLQNFLEERSKSVRWLKSLDNPPWDNAYQHPKFGPLTARMFLYNWLAHDYLHIRQITRTNYQYLDAHSKISLRYAGEW